MVFFCEDGVVRWEELGKVSSSCAVGPRCTRNKAPACLLALRVPNNAVAAMPPNVG